MKKSLLPLATIFPMLVSFSAAAQTQFRSAACFKATLDVTMNRGACQSHADVINLLSNDTVSFQAKCLDAPMNDSECPTSPDESADPIAVKLTVVVIPLK